MRKEISSVDPATLDEGFLSTVDAWMNKSHQDGMVGILQSVLQMYAGIAIKNARTELQANVGAAVAGENQAVADKVLAEQEKEEKENPTTALMEQLMDMDTDKWDNALRQAFEGEVGPKRIMGEVQRTIEAVVLGLENGSMAQRVQAEYLKELVTRIETVEKQMQ